LFKAEASEDHCVSWQHESLYSEASGTTTQSNRSAEEAETAKLLVRLDRGYEAKQFTIEKASGVEVLKE